MQTYSFQDGWKRIGTGLDVQVLHGVPVCLSHQENSAKKIEGQLNSHTISDKVLELTGFRISLQNWKDIADNEKESSVCINRGDFDEVLRRLALSSAAMFVDRFHKPLDRYAVDWNNTEFTYDFNHAAEHCCIPYDSLNKENYFNDYIKTMHDESVRLIDEGISPFVEAE